ncbi:MAG: L-threonylcarbamoyladenylate synthase [Proteobacteria bacterium]|nr:L-threonylcarbamoyladenylate synthase [Pseudomonadota bacterium]
MEILNGFEHSSIEKAVEILKKGALVAFPTETVYGLGADALNPYAVAKIFETKKRPRFDPLIVHIGEREWVSAIADYVPPEAEKLIDRYWPGPLTMILKKKDAIPGIVTAGLSTVAIRMPSHPVALQLIRSFDGPIAAPSANPFGYISPTNAQHVAKMLGESVPLILDGGSSNYGIESTIVSFHEGKTYLHRHGAISLEELSATAGAVYEKSNNGSCEAPGQLPYHYAPIKPLKIIKTIDEIHNMQSSFLAFKKSSETPISKYVKILSSTGNMREAAANFFSCLIELDRDDIDIIYAENIPETGLGKAMMERLKKASKKYRYITH